jgi:hypothetical protein
MEDSKKTALQELADLSEDFQKAIDEQVEQEEAFWNSLSQEEQLSAFCCVARRINEGELKERTTYRGMLYGVMGFGPEAYSRALEAGYMSIHNSLFDASEQDALLTRFAKFIGVANPEEKVKDFFNEQMGRYPA